MTQHGFKMIGPAAWNFARQQWDNDGIDYTRPYEYMPQDSSAFALYNLHVKMGKTPPQAMLDTLKACTGQGAYQE